MSKTSPCSLLRFIAHLANLKNAEALVIAHQLADESSTEYTPKLICHEIELGSNTYHFDIA